MNCSLWASTVGGRWNCRDFFYLLRWRLRSWVPDATALTVSRGRMQAKVALNFWFRVAICYIENGSQPRRLTMSLRINDTAPDFTAETTEGTIRFHEWIGDGWAVLFSHPKDFTPVCTTELGYMAGLQPEFKKRNAKIIGLSVDPVDDHRRWSKDIEETQGHAPNYPMIGDHDLHVSKLYGMLPATAGETSEAAPRWTTRRCATST